MSHINQSSTIADAVNVIASTAERVQAAIKELDFAARVLTSRRTNTRYGEAVKTAHFCK